MTTRLWQQVEGALVLVSLVVALLMAGLPWSWWVALLIFFAPDLGFAGYLAGPRVGAFIYNCLHIYGFGVAVSLVGLVAASPGLIAAGVLFTAHVGFDRMLGYGLEEVTGFKNTHMGQL